MLMHAQEVRGEQPGTGLLLRNVIASCHLIVAIHDVSILFGHS